MRSVLLLCFLVSLLAGCSLAPSAGTSGRSPSPAAQPTPSGIPAADKNGPVAVAKQLFPDSGTPCGHTGNYAPCPLTPELARRLGKAPLQYVDQLCRCTGSYRSPMFTAVSLPSGDTVVKVELTLANTPQAGQQQSLDVTVTHPDGVWWASDITCFGRGTSTSLFSDAPTNCFAISG